ncbi:MAG: pilus assembly protein PilM [Gammaproteobacteria bacterium]|nr:type IV pilus assembly protein PilM [Gammaproteobacteria bacterium]NIO61740.1 type IV pilus assembly protein PilM [Gammaproteobacteria bacterium]NIP48610.1 pilus assembly protein PilM [Gammaproteobacteria bacterium]NIQ09062.1 pilus assembly protein PilM [Gammaproteobacteria bacterium]NIQ18991.1 type IV pilus assembly protein PilM [Gammaproteobacteria bacterium]
MLSLFGNKSTPVLGIDISATAIKLLELGGSPGKYRVESYSVEPLPANSVVDKNISDEHAVGEAIGRAVKKSGTKLREAAVAVAGSAVITKIISMPANISDRDMETQINLEADQYIPFPLEEVNIDFEIIGPSAQSDDQVDILLAASRSENIDLRVASLNVGGLKAKVVDVEAFALENAIGLLAQHLGVGEGSTIAIADVGSTITTYSVLEDFKIIYSREQNFGGAQLTEEIQRRYGLSYEEAGLAKKQGGLPENYEPEVLDPFKQSMAQQISRAQQFFFSSSQIATVDHLILAGGCSSIPGISEVVETAVGVPTTVANPFENMSISSRVPTQALHKDSPALMVACGLALRSFD